MQPCVTVKLAQHVDFLQAGACGGKTQAFATYSESQKALALQAYTDAGLSGKVFDSMGGGEKVWSYHTNPPAKFVITLSHCRT